jgi:hypothetical protein
MVNVSSLKIKSSMRAFLIVAILTSLVGCKTTAPSPGASSGLANYQEDLTSSLPQYPDFRTLETKAIESAPLESAVSVDDELENLSNTLKEKNKSEPYFSGYTILVYSGIDRSQAFSVRDNLALYYPNLPAEMQYQEPRYLMKVGRYGYRFEAQKNLALIKSQFPSARIIQERFQRKESTPK